ncbi:MAG: class I SAM-dependent methyltransferase [Acidobacteriaceae bacterium]
MHLTGRNITNKLRASLDDWLPPVVRDSAIFRLAVRLWLGPNAIPDFKCRAFDMSDEAFAKAYRDLGGLYTERPSDTTEAQAEWILANIGQENASVLEIGPGAGYLTKRLRDAGHSVTELELSVNTDSANRIQGTLERLPFPDKSFDVVILAHVLEHARSLTRAFLHLERVSKGRVLIVTPKQRFYKWTFDYHLHFFYSVEHLGSHIHKGQAHGSEINGDLCLVWDVAAGLSNGPGGRMQSD